MMARNSSDNFDPALLKQAFGAVVTRHRVKLAMSRERFGEMVGIGGSHLSRIERGEYAPNLITIRKIADGIGYTSGELLDETDDYLIRHLLG